MEKQVCVRRSGKQLLRGQVFATTEGAFALLLTLYHIHPNLSFSLGDVAEGILGVRSHVLLQLEEMGDQGHRVFAFGVVEPEDVNLLFAQNVAVDVHRVGKVLVDEDVSDSVDDLVFWVGSFFTQHHVLKRS